MVLACSGGVGAHWGREGVQLDTDSQDKGWKGKGRVTFPLDQASLCPVSPFNHLPQIHTRVLFKSSGELELNISLF